ncbi:serine/threonine-protein kinase [Nocardia farcinica]|uniref:serine/threonine-protein kinase n=1 Tax=Nocardia farcinica TaxID=37329 RepID=UPI00245587B4|nr:serine/threonine-protein kinase [Nocardia farcinica]
MLEQGSVFAGYTIERLLGRGGMGSVYLARHPRLPRWTALKLLNRELFHDTEIRARFEREADLVAQLDHPNIVTVFDRGVEDEQLWISMRYIDGTDAAALDVATLPPWRAVQIVGETAKALDFAHARGVLHRDVKPANILLERAEPGVGERVYLTDFGIARLRDDTGHLTRTGTFTATLAFASPEQLSGAPLDHRSDQYSLACTLFRLLTGTVPFAADNPVAVIGGHLHRPPPAAAELRPGLPAAIDAVLARALAKDPRDRFATCLEFVDAAWRALLPGRPQPATPPAATPLAQPSAAAFRGGPHGPAPSDVPPVVYVPPGSRRSRAPVAALLGIAVVALVLVAAVVVAIDRGSDSGVPQARQTTAPVLPSTAMPGPTPGKDDEDDEPHAADLAAVTKAFPGMTPEVDKRALMHVGPGHNGTTCFSRGAGASNAMDSTAPDFGAFRAYWYCFGGSDGNKANYELFVYDDAEAAAAVLATLPAHTRSTARHGDKAVYTNYLLDDSPSSLRPRMVTQFTGDDKRARFLLYSVGFIATREEFLAWWHAAPLS